MTELFHGGLGCRYGEMFTELHQEYTHRFACNTVCDITLLMEMMMI